MIFGKTYKEGSQAHRDELARFIKRNAYPRLVFTPWPTRLECGKIAWLSGVWRVLENPNEVTGLFRYAAQYCYFETKQQADAYFANRFEFDYMSPPYSYQRSIYGAAGVVPPL